MNYQEAQEKFARCRTKATGAAIASNTRLRKDPEVDGAFVIDYACAALVRIQPHEDGQALYTILPDAVDNATISSNNRLNKFLVPHRTGRRLWTMGDFGFANNVVRFRCANVKADLRGDSLPPLAAGQRFVLTADNTLVCLDPGLSRMERTFVNRDASKPILERFKAFESYGKVLTKLESVTYGEVRPHLDWRGGALDKLSTRLDLDSQAFDADDVARALAHHFRTWSATGNWWHDDKPVHNQADLFVRSARALRDRIYKREGAYEKREVTFESAFV